MQIPTRQLLLCTYDQNFDLIIRSENLIKAAGRTKEQSHTSYTTRLKVGFPRDPKFSSPGISLNIKIGFC